MTINDTDQSHLLKDLTFTEKADYEKGFSAYFEEKIKPELAFVENLRFKKIALIKKRKKILIIGLIILIILLNYLFPYVFIISLFIKHIFISIPLLFVFIRILFAFIKHLYKWAFIKQQKRYKLMIKEIIMPVITSFLGEFNYTTIVPDYRLNIFGILPYHNEFYSEDYIQGYYKNIKIELFEMVLKINDDYYSNITFKGFCVLLTMNKKFNGQTIVKIERNRLNNISYLTRVKLEDPEFESKFEVYSSDQIEARYLLTTAFMERFLNLTKIYNSQEIQCSFFNDQLFIMIPTKQKLFEPQGLEKSIINTDDIHIFLAQMQWIFQIVDVLKLNQKIGM